MDSRFKRLPWPVVSFFTEFALLAAIPKATWLGVAVTQVEKQSNAHHGKKKWPAASGGRSVV